MIPRTDPTAKSRAGSDDPSIVPALMHLLDRIEEVVRDEIKVVSAGSTAEIDAMVSRKSYLLVELMRLMKNFDASQRHDALTDRMNSLSRTLDKNARTLRRHITAVRDVLGIITDVIATSSDDGTYSGRIERSAGVI